MSLKLKGFDKFITKLDTFENRLEVAIKDRFSKLSNEYVEDVRDNQMSGRPGLEQRTGTLANSIVSKVESQKYNVRAVMGSDVKYIYAHEYGTEYIPKRLTMRDLFNNTYQPMYSEAIENAIQEVIDG